MDLNSIPAPKRGWGNIAVASWSHFVGDFYCNLLPVLLPLLALKFGLSYSQCGLLYMIFQVNASFLQAPIGIAADKHNLGIILPISIFTGGVLASAVGLCSSEWLLVIIIFLSGICSSGFHPIAGGMVPIISPKGKEVLATSLFIVGGNIGFAVAPFITALYLEFFTQEEIIYLAVIPVVTTLLLFKRGLYSKPKPENAAQIISLKKIISNKPFLLLVSSIGLRAVCYCSLVIFIPLLYAEKGISSVSASSVLMTLLIGTATGGMLVGAISTRFKLKTLIVYSYALTITMMAIFMYKADDSVLSYVSIFLAGVGLYGSTPPAIVWAQKLLPHADSFATSMMLGFTFGIGYALSVFVGWLGDYIGLQQSLVVWIFSTMFLATVVILRVKEKN